MKITLIISLAALTLLPVDAGKTTGKGKSSPRSHLAKKLTGKPKPAIIAIEIVDPIAEKLQQKSKNSKRTIDSHLGYGYQPPQPRYQVYKYSQHDIPSYQQHHFRPQNNDFQITKSVSYQLPSLTQYYQPGTTLYASVNHQGGASDLSAHAPGYEGEPHVPVIILKVYPSQLAHPGALFANLPPHHPLADSVNSVDIQGLLANYRQQHYQQPQEEQQQHYQQPQEQELLTHENYPKETHTRVVFRTDKNQLGVAPSDAEQRPVFQTQHAQSYTEMPSEYGYSNEASGMYFYQGGEQQQQQQGEEAEQQYYYGHEVAPEQQPPPPHQQLEYQSYGGNRKRSSNKAKKLRGYRTEYGNFRLHPIK